MKFEAVFGKLWNPFGNKEHEQSDCVIFFFNSLGYSKKICLASHSHSLFFERNELLEPPFRKPHHNVGAMT